MTIQSEPWTEDDATMLQLHVHFTDQAAAEPAVLVHLLPALAGAQDAGHLAHWHFVRKGDRWRLRYQPVPDTDPNTAEAALTGALVAARAAGSVTGWSPVIYEPEILAFGGESGMDAAHELFHHDSSHILHHLAAHGGRDQRHELAVLLATALMRGASQEWYEQGDIWARVAAHRPTAEPGQTDRLAPAVQRLMSVDTSPGSALANGVLAFASPWIDTHTHAGQALRRLAHDGRLTRGLRAVLAQHLLFHFNRLGLPPAAQGAIATTASRVVLGQE
ncbi:thiopeptide-type bacteriocin biosynthesis protein [Kitasatospora sp. NPDC058162]|uniref:thiopeptide-type bacteriocin biosynthesis protein n=1 Tax=Kitasatospora sp. NPDC058162 TaxID=3346362 RepID=UPI0036DF6B96